jgi:hypothetical protein
VQLSPDAGHKAMFPDRVVSPSVLSEYKAPPLLLRSANQKSSPALANLPRALSVPRFVDGISHTVGWVMLVVNV